MDASSAPLTTCRSPPSALRSTGRLLQQRLGVTASALHAARLHADGSLRAPSPAPGDRNTFRPRHERAPSFTSRPPSFTSRASPGRANDDAAAAAAAPALVKHGVGSATSGRPQGTSLQAFKTEESVDAYLTNLAHELSMIAEQPTTIFKSQAVDPVESLTQALEVLDATVGTLSDVQSRAMRHVSFLSVRPLWPRRSGARAGGSAHLEVVARPPACGAARSHARSCPIRRAA